MAQVTIDRKSKKVIIELPLVENPMPSSTGDTTAIADARNETTGVTYEHDGVTRILKVSARVYWSNKVKK